MSASPLWNKKIKCPFCNHEFETTRLRSSAVKVLRKDSDFGAVYEGTCPYYYAITACPNCLFAARNEDFEGIRAEYEPKIIEACKRAAASQLPKPGIFQVGEIDAEVAMKRHELAIAFLKLRSHLDLGDLAGLNMHLVWIFRLVGDASREQHAMEQALKAYAEYFEKGGKLPEKLGEPGVLFLIGELHRRCNRPKEARRYYERALASREIKSFPAVEHQTREAMMQAKEAMEQGHSNP
jgi:uncharacterized protein (DUF2225 family)